MVGATTDIPVLVGKNENAVKLREADAGKMINKRMKLGRERSNRQGTGRKVFCGAAYKALYNHRGRGPSATWRENLEPATNGMGHK